MLLLFFVTRWYLIFIYAVLACVYVSRAESIRLLQYIRISLVFVCRDSLGIHTRHSTLIDSFFALLLSCAISRGGLPCNPFGSPGFSEFIFVRKNIGRSEKKIDTALRCSMQIKNREQNRSVISRGYLVTAYEL